MRRKSRPARRGNWYITIVSNILLLNKPIPYNEIKTSKCAEGMTPIGAIISGENRHRERRRCVAYALQAGLVMALHVRGDIGMTT